MAVQEKMVEERSILGKGFLKVEVLDRGKFVEVCYKVHEGEAKVPFSLYRPQLIALS